MRYTFVYGLMSPEGGVVWFPAPRPGPLTEWLEDRLADPRHYIFGVRPVPEVRELSALDWQKYWRSADAEGAWHHHE